MTSTHWKLMFLANKAEYAQRCLARTLLILPAQIVEPLKLYWKQPELWEVSLRCDFSTPLATGIHDLLITANQVANGWYIIGPNVENDRLTDFNGIFDANAGHAWVEGLAWASFSVSEVTTLINL